MQETADLITFTGEVCNGKLHFLCSDYSLKGLSFSPELSDERINFEEKTENVSPEFRGNFTYFSYFHIELAYEHPEVYHLMEGKQAYTIENLLGQSGGFLGLMMGASLLSVV